MTLHVFRHISYPDHRESIERTGLKPHRPYENNYTWCEEARNQPEGVYVTHEAEGNATWWAPEASDEWVFPYVGPLVRDPIISQAFIISEVVPAEVLTLAAHE